MKVPVVVILSVTILLANSSVHGSPQVPIEQEEIFGNPESPAEMASSFDYELLPRSTLLYFDLPPLTPPAIPNLPDAPHTGK